MKPAMSNIAWLPEERSRAYGLLAEAGVSGLEIAPALFFHTTDDPFEPDESVARTAMAEIADAGLSLVSMQSLLFGVSGAALFEGAEARAALEAAMLRAIKLAGRFGIPNLVFGSPKQRRVPAGVPAAQALEEAAGVFRRLGDAAHREGTKIAIEPSPEVYGTNFLNTLEAATDFVSRVDHSSIALILDLGAMLMNGPSDTVLKVDPRIVASLNHVHVSEPNLAPAPAEAEALAPVLRMLDAQGFDKAISIEMRRPEDGLVGVASALGRLKSAMAIAK